MNHSLIHRSLILISRLLRLGVELPARGGDQTSPTLTFADESLLGDGLLAYIATLGLLEWLQLEVVGVDALQLVGLRREEEGREIRGRSVECMPTETHLVFSHGIFFYGCTRGFDFFDGL